MAARIPLPQSLSGQLEKLVSEKRGSGKLQMNEAVSLFHRLLRAEKPKPSIYYFNYILITISRMNHPNRYPSVISLFSRLNQARNLGVFPSIHTFGVVINCCCRMGRVGLGFIVLGQLFRAGCIVNPIIFGPLLKGLCIENRIGDAVKMFDKMSLDKMSLLDGLCSNGNTKLGLRLYEEMARKGWSCEPNVVTYNTLIKGLCNEGDVSVGFEWFEKMIAKRVAPNVRTYTTLIDGLCKSSDFVRAFKLREEMIAKGVVPDVITYNALISGQCRVGSMDKAFELFNEMDKLRLAPDVFTYNSLIDGCCKQGDLRMAVQLLEETIAKDLRPNVVTYTSIIHSFLADGQWKNAIKLFSEMINNGVSPNIVTLAH